MTLELLTWTGAVLSSLVCLPQAVRAAGTDHLQGLVPGSSWLVLADAVVRWAWAVGTGDLAAGVAGLVNGPAALLVLARIHVARRLDRPVDRSRRPAAAGTPLARAG